MTILGYVNGQTDLMLAPIDQFSNFCGYTTGFTDSPYLYVPSYPNYPTKSSSFF